MNTVTGLQRQAVEISSQLLDAADLVNEVCNDCALVDVVLRLIHDDASLVDRDLAVVLAAYEERVVRGKLKDASALIEGVLEMLR